MLQGPRAALCVFALGERSPRRAGLGELNWRANRLIERFAPHQGRRLGPCEPRQPTSPDRSSPAAAAAARRCTWVVAYQRVASPPMANSA